MFMALSHFSLFNLLMNSIQRGNIMKFLSAFIKALILSGMIFLLLDCGSKTVQIAPVQPVVPESPLSTTSAAKIKVYNFLDARPGKLDPYLIGHKAITKFCTSDVKAKMGSVYNDRPVYETVTEAVKSDFTRKGYKIVQENEDFSVKGRIDQFWVKTPLKMMGAVMDAEGEVTLTMEVSRPGQKGLTTLGPYKGRKVERAMIPSPEMFKQVLKGALMDAIQAMSSDPNLINELSKKPKN
jgi:uncharacterized lipoprotein YajG